jgi:hypothetical protein
MFISHRKQFIFLHNYKVAGTSIRGALKKYNNRSFLVSAFPDQVRFLTNSFPKVYSKDFDHHVSARDLQKQISSDIFDSYYKFGFVRNPWDWQISLYRYMLKRPNHAQHEIAKGFKDFKEYLDWRVHEDLNLQKEFFFSEDGENLTDFIGKMETLNSDFDKICKQINVNASLSHLNPSRKKDDPISNYYDEDDVQLIAEAFAEDIKLFDYAPPILKPSAEKNETEP